MFNVDSIERQVAQAMEAYFSDKADNQFILENMHEGFPLYMANMAEEKKASLRSIFSRHPKWNDELQAVIIPGVKASIPLDELEDDIFEVTDDLCKMFQESIKCPIANALTKFFVQLFSPETMDIQLFNLVQGAFPKGGVRLGRKSSHIARGIFGDMTPINEFDAKKFEQKFAVLADLLAHKGEKEETVFISINPAHILTASNPKVGGEGMLTSCHSLNNLDHVYSAGPSGYVNDEVTFIVFTVKDPRNVDSTYCRKTHRMMGHYVNGRLITSRLYSSCGGVDETNALSDAFRHVAQEVIAFGLDADNIWTEEEYNHPSCPDEDVVYCDCNFGGYCDWQYPQFLPILSKLEGHVGPTFEVGGSGTCIITCGDNSEYSICERYMSMKACACCGHEHVQDEMFSYGGEYYCPECTAREFPECPSCGGRHPHDIFIKDENGENICEGCYSDTHSECAECGVVHLNSEFYRTERGQLLCKECGEARGLRLVLIEDEVWNLKTYEWR